MAETTLSVANATTLLAVLGTRDQHLRLIRDALGVRVSARDGQISIEGDEESVALTARVLEQIQTDVERFGSVTPEDVARMLGEVRSNGKVSAGSGPISVYTARQIRPRTPGQAAYVEAIRSHDVVLCDGPAGTGKTYLAVATAVQSLREERVRKIVLARPAVEAGESLGFLPGDLQAKINPYLRPLMDALREMMDHEAIKRYTEQDLIEVIPLAYMRGRTLNDAFMLLDEAQNTTVAQMKMFLTRMGNGSKILVSGDTTQIDLPPHARSGLIDALHRLRHLAGIAKIRLTEADIVRHPLVQEIVRAYETKPEKRRGA